MKKFCSEQNTFPPDHNNLAQLVSWLFTKYLSNQAQVRAGASDCCKQVPNNQFAGKWPPAPCHLANCQQSDQSHCRTGKQGNETYIFIAFIKIITINVLCIGLVDFHLYLNNSKIVRTLRDDGTKDMIKKSWQSTFTLQVSFRVQWAWSLLTRLTQNWHLFPLPLPPRPLVHLVYLSWDLILAWA